MAEAGEAGVEEEQSPTRREVRVFYLSSAQAPDKVYEEDDDRGIERHSKERVRESAMMREGEGWTFNTAENVQIGSLGSKRQRKRG